MTHPVIAFLGFVKNRFKRLDKLLLLLCIAASAFGIYMLYTMVQNGINPNVIRTGTWKMQLASALLGIFLALVIALIPYKIISKIWFVYTPIALILSMLLFTSLGMSTEGSDEVNWLNLGFIQIQPSEFLTVAFIMTFSTHIYKLGDKMNQLPHVILLCVHAMIPAGIMVLQKNTGAPVLLLLIFLLMLFMAGISWKYIVAAVPLSIGAVLLFWNFYAKEYQKMRILVVFDEELQKQEIRGYFHQQFHSLMAMGSGGLTGQGLSGGDYISFFAIHNDFVFSYIGMTLGLIGCVVVLTLLMLICIKILAVMSSAKDPLGRAICAGAFAAVFFHTVINVGMAIVVTPVVGVPLPFISAGGSSTLALYIAIGLVLSVRAHKDKEYHMFYTEKD